MSTIRSYRDLDAWKMAMRLAKECYRITSQFPRTEQFGLSQQLRRAAVSVPSNLAEGNGSRKRQVYIHHVNIALTDVSRQLGRLMLALVRALEAPRAS